MKKQGIMFWVIVLLVAIGIIDSLFVSHHIPLSSILVPVAVIGIVFLLYKFPPRKIPKGSAENQTFGAHDGQSRRGTQACPERETQSVSVSGHRRTKRQKRRRFA